MTNSVATPNQQSTTRRCLIVERNEWETGGAEQQLQFVLEPAAQFFGPGNAARHIQVRVFTVANAPTPTYTKNISISRVYTNGTRRTNGFPEIGDLPSCFVFFEETSQQNVYNFWLEPDRKRMLVIAAKYDGWYQGRDPRRPGYGRGRLSVIVPAPVVPRIMNAI